MSLYAIFYYIQEQGLLGHLYPLWKRALFYINVTQIQDRTRSEVECLQLFLQDQHPQLYELLQRSSEKIFRTQDELLRWKDKGIKILLWGDPDYPFEFYSLPDAPLIFSVWGHVTWGERRALSVVGSRDPAFETRQWIEFELSSFLREEKVVVISGGARGVDQLAHASSLRLGLPTLAVLPSGLGNIYPRGFEEMAVEIIKNRGCLISEYGLRRPMHKGHFHHRNRLIAALSVATLVVQANVRSGTMITARHAAELSRPVLVVPGHASDLRFRGGLDLIAEGAQMVRDALDLNIFWRAESLNFLNRDTHLVDTLKMNINM
jgi:DNA processing protein